MNPIIYFSDEIWVNLINTFETVLPVYFETINKIKQKRFIRISDNHEF